MFIQEGLSGLKVHSKEIPKGSFDVNIHFIEQKLKMKRFAIWTLKDPRSAHSQIFIFHPGLQ